MKTHLIIGLKIGDNWIVSQFALNYWLNHSIGYWPPPPPYIFVPHPSCFTLSHSIYMVSISEKSESDSDRFDPKILKLRGVTTIILLGCATWSDQNCRFYNQKTDYFQKFLKKMANLAAADFENPKTRLGILKVISKGTNCLNFRS